MKIFTDVFEQNIENRIARGERVYLIEIYKELGFETYLLPQNHPAYQAFWDKNGFHENDYLECVILSPEVDVAKALSIDPNDIDNGSVEQIGIFYTI